MCVCVCVCVFVCVCGGDNRAMKKNESDECNGLGLNGTPFVDS